MVWKMQWLWMVTYSFVGINPV